MTLNHRRPGRALLQAGCAAALIRRLMIVPGATHLFEEPGALEEVARLAGDWFADHLRLAARTSRTGPAGRPAGS